MPVPLWTPVSKAEAKYNVITEFPKLGLHFAAASGNIGLVEYALDHGQPINSVLDGVLPIHAASAGGHPQVVKLLIEHGADVNAPRLPRRYFNDRHRDSSAPIVGTSGSTPLHFAAANGHNEVVKLLLRHGAHPDLKDKYQVTPELLAEQNNWLECAHILREWAANKDRDLREREASTSLGDGAGGTASTSQLNTSGSTEPDSPYFRRRLHVKHSIDTALNILKSASHVDSLRPNDTSVNESPLPSPLKPFGEYDFNPNENGSPIDPQSRRPSLPHILQPSDETSARKGPSPLRSPKVRRPRSAGTGADRTGEQEIVYIPYGRGGSGRKLGSKISLLGLFKKGHCETNEGSNPLPQSVSSTALPLSSSVKSSSIPHQPSRHGSAVDLNGDYNQSFNSTSSRGFGRAHAASDASAKIPKVVTQPRSQAGSSYIDFSDSVPPTPNSPPPIPSAVDLHNALAQQTRHRSRSNATNVSGFSTFSDDYSISSSAGQSPRLQIDRSQDDSFTQPDFAANNSIDNRSLTNNNSLREQPSSIHPNEGSVRPGILRGHNRAPSSGQATSTPVRALRFDSTTSAERSKKEPNDSTIPPIPLEISTSSGSLRSRANGNGADDHSSLRAASSNILNNHPHDQDAEATNYDQNQGLQQRQQPQYTKEAETNGINTSVASKRHRGMSFGSSSDASLSPDFTNDNTTVDTMPLLRADFPFSINQPPPQFLDEKSAVSDDNQLQVPNGRGRGDSVSSTSTTGSRNVPHYNMSGSTIGSNGSGGSPKSADTALTSPSISKLLEDKDNTVKIVESTVSNDSALPSQHTSSYTTINDRRAHSPLDIDITLISSHAQAEALVEKTRQDILEQASGQEVSSGALGNIPLSARLAAYGESLALERRLREKEMADKAQGSQQSSPISSRGDRLESLNTLPARPVRDTSRSGVERQLSLDKSGGTKPRSKVKDPRRPSTADGLLTRNTHNTFEHSRQTHHPSLSLSPPGLVQPSSSSDRREFFSSSHHQRFPTTSSSIPIQTNHERFATSSKAPSRKVDIDEDLESLSQLSSADGIDTETESPTVLLAATPAGHSRVKQNQGRTSSSAKKLTRMGFTTDPMARPPPAPSGKLFGGFKSIMQTLKGKP